MTSVPDIVVSLPRPPYVEIIVELSSCPITVGFDRLDLPSSEQCCPSHISQPRYVRMNRPFLTDMVIIFPSSEKAKIHGKMLDQPTIS